MWLLTLAVTAAIGLAAVIRSSNFQAWTYTFFIDFPAIKRYLTDTGVGYDSLFQFVAWLLPAVAIGLSALRTFFLLKGGSEDKEVSHSPLVPASKTAGSTSSNEQITETPNTTKPKPKTQRTSTPDILGDILGGVKGADEMRKKRDLLLTAMRKEWSMNVSSNEQYSQYLDELDNLRALNRAKGTSSIWVQKPGTIARRIFRSQLSGQLSGINGWLMVLDANQLVERAVLVLKLTKELLDDAQRSPNSPIPLYLLFSDFHTNNSNVEQLIVNTLTSKYNVDEAFATHLVNANALVIIVSKFRTIFGLCRCLAAIEEFRSVHSIPFALAGITGVCLRMGCQFRIYNSFEAYEAAKVDPDSDAAKLHNCITLVADAVVEIRSNNESTT